MTDSGIADLQFPSLLLTFSLLHHVLLTLGGCRLIIPLKLDTSFDVPGFKFFYIPFKAYFPHGIMGFLVKYNSPVHTFRRAISESLSRVFLEFILSVLQHL